MTMADLFLSKGCLRTTVSGSAVPHDFVYSIGGTAHHAVVTDPDITTWCVSLLNRGRHGDSSQDNFPLGCCKVQEGQPGDAALRTDPCR